MMKYIKGLLLMILCLGILTGCAANDNSQNNNQQKDPENISDTKETEDRTQEDGSNGDSKESGEDLQKEDPETIKATEPIRIASLKGPTSIGLVKVMEDASKNASANSYDFSIMGTADEISTGLVQGDIDLAAIPANLASVLYNKTEGQIILGAINTLSVLYIVETGDAIQTVEDLRGKTIYSTGFGTTPQYTLNYLLSSYGIDPEKDVTIEYKSEATEVASILSEAEDAIAMLPQPFVTSVMMNNEKVRIALDVAKEWDAINIDSSIVTGVLVVRKDFLENHKEAFNAFLLEYAASTEFVNKNISEAAALVEKFDIFKAAIAEKAIPYCKIAFIQGEEMKNKVAGYLGTLYEQNPKAVGGNLPGDDFYYIEKAE